MKLDLTAWWVRPLAYLLIAGVVIGGLVWYRLHLIGYGYDKGKAFATAKCETEKAVAILAGIKAEKDRQAKLNKAAEIEEAAANPSGNLATIDARLKRMQNTIGELSRANPLDPRCRLDPRRVQLVADALAGEGQ